MFKEITKLIVVGVLISCSGKINNTLTNEELNGVKNVVGYFGGICDYSKALQISTNGSKHYYFELKLSQSQLINDPGTNIDLLASGVAYRFYSSLISEDSKFDQIRSQIIDSNGNTKQYVFDVT